MSRGHTEREADGREAADEGSAFRASRLVPFRDDPWRSPLETVALAGVVGAFWTVAELPGLVAGGVLVLSWYVVPAVGVFAVGAVLLGVLVDSPVASSTVGLPGAALVGLLFSNVLGTGPRRSAGVLLVASVALGGIVAATALTTESTWLAGVILLTVAALGYVSLDLITLSRARSATDE